MSSISDTSSAVNFYISKVNGGDVRVFVGEMFDQYFKSVGPDKRDIPNVTHSFQGSKNNWVVLSVVNVNMG